MRAEALRKEAHGKCVKHVLKQRLGFRVLGDFVEGSSVGDANALG